MQSDPKPYRVGRSHTGLGLFATLPIKKHALIVANSGPRIPTPEALTDAFVISNTVVRFMATRANRGLISGRIPMVKFRILAIPILTVGIALSAASALAQGKSIKEQITGTWSLVSYDAIAADGSRKPIFSPNPKGKLILNANGHYAMIIVDPNRPKKWTGKSRAGASSEELASAARGFVGQFGEWSVDENSKVLVRKNEGGLNPLAAGREQKVQVAISGDELRTTDAASGVSGGGAETVWRRVK